MAKGCSFFIGDNMTKEEKAIRNEQMRQYKAEGHTMAEVAEKFNLHEGTVTQICKGIAPQYRPCKIYRNQYSRSDYDRLGNCKKIIENANKDFEYVGGFTTVDGHVDIKCKKCGYTFSISLITLRHKSKNHKCPECSRRIKERAKIRERERKKRIKASEKLLNKTLVQTAMKFCEVCGNPFLGTNKKKYCSLRCQHQNKWMMKDGYRYKFSLKELYDRDAGVCYICGGLCDWEDKQVVNGVWIYGNNYPSRDHVIPKSKGGENSWDNLRLAHRLCNSRKRDIPLSENF